MKKSYINVPEGIKYLSDWKEFFNLIPLGSQFILDKKICGCGATEAFLRSSDFKVILASPRKHLLYNKYSQHLDDDMFLYRYDGDVDRYFRGDDGSLKIIKTKEDYINDLMDYIHSGGKKILVTYDSLPEVYSTIIKSGTESVQNWIVVVDEMQSLFYDSFFKSDTESNTVFLLSSYFKTVIYLSATPFLEKYLDKISYFSTLELVQLNWPESSIIRPKVTLVPIRISNVAKCKEIVDLYRKGKGQYEIVGGEMVTSKEAVFYLNNVKDITAAIKKCGLEPEEVNVICSNSLKNRRLLGKLNGKRKGMSKYKIGSIPSKGEPHKMFTFCTSTVYIGSDFYSTSAYSYIFANPKIDSMAIDVSVDLQQILGRERLEANPFKNKATMFYSKTTKPITKEEAEKEFQKKIEGTNRRLTNFSEVSYPEEIAADIETVIKVDGHKDQYCSVIKDPISGKVKLIRSSIVEMSDRRAWEVINQIYNNDFSMYMSIRNSTDATFDLDTNDKDVNEVFNVWVSLRKFNERAKFFCDLYDNNKSLLDKCTFIERKYRDYHFALGKEGFEAAQWREDKLKEIIKAKEQNPRLTRLPKSEVHDRLMEFLKGKDYVLSSDVKNELINIYKDLGFIKRPTAEDMAYYVTYRRTSVKRDGKTINNAIKITSPYRKNVSILSNIYTPRRTQTINIDDVLEIIKTGNEGIKEKIKKYRKGKIGKDSLPGVCYNGVFNEKKNTGLKIYSSFLALDFDNIQDPETLKKKIKRFQFVYSAFVTPSAKGLKVIVLHDNFNPIDHEELYNQVIGRFKNYTGLDTCTKDIARCNFMSYDPNIYINPNAIPYHFVPSQNEPLKETEMEYITMNNDQPIIRKYSEGLTEFLGKLHNSVISDEEILRKVKGKWGVCVEEGERNNTSLTYSSILCRAGIEKDKALSFLQSLFPGFDVFERINYAYDHNSFGIDRLNYLYQ